MMGSADCWRKVRLDFSASLSFSLISSHSGSLAGLGAGSGGCGAGREELGLERFPAIGYRDASVMSQGRVGFGPRPSGRFGCDVYHGRGAHPEMGREGCQLGCPSTALRFAQDERRGGCSGRAGRAGVLRLHFVSLRTNGVGGDREERGGRGPSTALRFAQDERGAVEGCVLSLLDEPTLSSPKGIPLALAPVSKSFPITDHQRFFFGP